MTNLNTETLPVLTTERLTLRQLSIDDHQDIFALRSDPELNKFLDRQLCRTTEDAISFINKINENIAKSNTCYWGITLTDTKTLVGVMNVVNERCNFESRLPGERSLLTHPAGG